VNGSFAGNCSAPQEPAAAQVAQGLDVFATGDAPAVKNDLVGEVIQHRLAPLARDELRAPVSAYPLAGVGEPRRGRVVPA
jgi:hypothetical protein